MKTIPKKYLKDVPLEVQREEKPHYVYFILAKEGNLKRIKIGRCDKEDGIMKRFSSLNTSSPIDLKIIGYLKGYEKDWHKYFKEHKIKGEWFDFNKIEHILVRLQLKVPKEILDTFKDQIRLHYSKDDKEDIFNELKKINSNVYATTEYQKRIFGERSEWFYLHRASKKFNPNDENYEHITEHAYHISKLLNLFCFGTDFSSNVRITEARTIKLDRFYDPIYPGEIYYQTDESNRGGRYGISVRTGFILFRAYKNFLRLRKRGVYVTGFENNGRRQKQVTAEKKELLHIINNLSHDIKKDLGILVFDGEKNEWIDNSKNIN
jgi:hypothetical protein